LMPPTSPWINRDGKRGGSSQRLLELGAPLASERGSERVDEPEGRDAQSGNVLLSEGGPHVDVALGHRGSDSHCAGGTVGRPPPRLARRVSQRRPTGDEARTPQTGRLRPHLRAVRVRRRSGRQISADRDLGGNRIPEPSLTR